MKAAEQIAEALQRVKKIAESNHGHVVQSKQLQRADRELLKRTGWLQEVIKGWYFLVRPDARVGESSVWYAHFWDFLSIYLNSRFGNQYCLSAESSLDLHTQATTIPKQIIVMVSKGGGGPIDLPFNTSLYIYVDKNLSENAATLRGLQVMTLPLALCKVSAAYFEKNQRDAEIALRLIRTSSELSEILLQYGFKVAAKRLIGAYEHIGHKQLADDIAEDLKTFGWQINGENPFMQKPVSIQKTLSPHVARIYALWKEYRTPVIEIFSDIQPHKQKIQTRLKTIEDLYKEDAYHSLSIEGYQVNADLIARVQNHEWDPETQPQDYQEFNALAAKGYYQAFLAVKKSIETMVKEKSPGRVIEQSLKRWYQQLFAPMVLAGLIPDRDLLGYRKHQVYIRNSRHVPLPNDALIDGMEALFDCLKNEEHAIVKAILGHYIFVYIHPYMDGNGRLGRFLMNAMLLSGGYPWTIIHVEDRTLYLEALETAGCDHNIKPFAKFMKASLIRKR